MRPMRPGITLKLFFAILAASAVAAAAMALATRLSFQSGFFGYLNHVQSQSLEAFAGRLADEYRRTGDWSFLQGDYGRLRALAAPPQTVQRLTLFDAEHRPVIGNPEPSEEAAMRPVIVALTAEGPEFSNRQHDQVIDPLKSTGAAFNAVMIGRPSSSLSSEARERGIVLDDGTRTTCGARIEILAVESLGMKLKQLAYQLTHQYKVTYARPQSLIPPERFAVTATKPGLSARGTLLKDTKTR
jgi:hypothetical protein